MAAPESFCGRGRAWEDGAVTAEAAARAPALSPEVTARWQARFRAPRVSLPRLGAGRPAPQPLLLRRQRRRRAVRVGPRDRRAPPGHRPAQRHADRHAQPGRRDRSGGSPTPTATSSASGDPAVRAAARTPSPSPRSSRPTRPGSRSAARWSPIGRSTDDGSELWLAPSGGAAAGDLPARRPGLGRRADPGRRAAGHLALRARRPALPGAAGAADGDTTWTSLPSSPRSGTARAAACTRWSSARCPTTGGCWSATSAAAARSC